MEHPGSRGLKRETLLLVEGLDQTTLDSPALDRFQVLDPASDLDLDLDQEDLFQEGLDLDYLGIPWETPSTTIVAPTHSIHPWHPSRHHVLLQHNHDREQPKDLDVPPEGRGQPPNPP